MTITINGREYLVEPLVTPGEPCPVCKRPFRVWRQLTMHLVGEHWFTKSYRCQCGFFGGRDGRRERALSSHLCAVHRTEGLAIHLAKANFKQAAQEP